MPVLVDYLRQLERRGVTHVALDDEARNVLREIYRAGQAAPRTAPAARATELSPSSPTFSMRKISGPATVAAVAAVAATGSTPQEQLDSLRGQAGAWAPARSLGTLRDTMVFATGNPAADLMLVGEAPGFEEERKGEPFVGKAGQKLDQILTAMGIARSDVYISNICKFRPAMKGQTTNNRKPTREEMDACLPFVRAEIAIVQPKCIVALGATAAQGLLESNEGVTRLRGSWHEFEGIPLRVTYHPSYLLHNDTAKLEKRKVWEDMLTVMERLEMPVSDKQRGFFGAR